MRFPFALTTKIAAYMIAQKLRGRKKFATVLQLEPLHTCNLTCTGCGRIREYSTSLKDMMSLEDCLASAQECEAPMVSICGGEPLIYPKIEELVAGLLDQGRIVYVCTEGVFMECVEAVRMAKILGYQVATNTTVYKETDMKEIEQMFEYFSSLEVDGHTISPGYEYDAAKKDMVKRLGKQPEDFFLTRRMTREKFAKIQEWGQKFSIFGTPVYQEFLAGKRELTCTAWAIPTRNIKGWKAPCYLMTDGHYARYQEMLDQVDWNKYGVVDGVARDARCENCMVHCGYDPSGALGTNYQQCDTWKNIKYNFAPKPKPYYPGKAVMAFNGCCIG